MDDLPVYDITTSTSEFIAGGIVVHNCKYQETWSIPAWIEQAKTNQLEGADWLLVCKKNREKPIVILDAEAFFRLCEKGIEKETLKL